MSIKKQYELEYNLNVSPRHLFPRLSTPEGLTGWFADKVTTDGKIYNFIWDNVDHIAKLIHVKELKNIKWKWLENNQDTIFFIEFRIDTLDLTNSTALYISDYCDEDELQENIDVWDSLVTKLKRQIGI